MVIAVNVQHNLTYLVHCIMAVSCALQLTLTSFHLRDTVTELTNTVTS